MRSTKATVHLGAIGHNLKSVIQLARSSKVLPVIKANAYGHGAVEVARKLECFRALDVPAFAVAFLEEALQLRRAGITRPLLVLQGSHHASDVQEAAASDLWLMVHNTQQVGHLLKSKASQAVRVWVKADTGMHRLGFTDSQLDAVLAALGGSDKVHQKKVLCSHLACGDELDNPLTQIQIRHLQRLAQHYNMHWSIANSAGIVAWPQSHADWVRPGYMLYGNSPVATDINGESGHPAIRLKPAMTMTSAFIAIRQIAAGEAVGYGHNWVAPVSSSIGILAIGYADGYPRHAASGTPVWFNGQRLPLVGRVSMDMIAVDLGGISHAAVGDKVELWGPNLSVNEVAAYAGTIGYEILAGLTGRVPISYLP